MEYLLVVSKESSFTAQVRIQVILVTKLVMVKAMLLFMV